MSVYPFYVEARAEGRKSPIAGGTRRKDGTMRIHLTQRDNGSITTAFTIECRNETVDGIMKLVSSVYDSNGDLVAEKYTDY